MRALKLLHFNSILILLAFSASCLLAQNTDDLTHPYTMDDNTVVLLHLDDDLVNASDSTADGTGFGSLLYLNNSLFQILLKKSSDYFLYDILMIYVLSTGK